MNNNISFEPKSIKLIPYNHFKGLNLKKEVFFFNKKIEILKKNEKNQISSKETIKKEEQTGPRENKPNNTKKYFSIQKKNSILLKLNRFSSNFPCEQQKNKENHKEKENYFQKKKYENWSINHYSNTYTHLIKKDQYKPCPSSTSLYFKILKQRETMMKSMKINKSQVESTVVTKTNHKDFVNSNKELSHFHNKKEKFEKEKTIVYKPDALFETLSEETRYQKYIQVLLDLKRRLLYMNLNKNIGSDVLIRNSIEVIKSFFIKNSILNNRNSTDISNGDILSLKYLLLSEYDEGEVFDYNKINVYSEFNTTKLFKVLINPKLSFKENIINLIEYSKGLVSPEKQSNTKDEKKKNEEKEEKEKRKKRKTNSEDESKEELRLAFQNQHNKVYSQMGRLDYISLLSKIEKDFLDNKSNIYENSQVEVDKDYFDSNKLYLKSIRSIPTRTINSHTTNRDKYSKMKKLLEYMLLKDHKNNQPFLEEESKLENEMSNKIRKNRKKWMTLI